MATKGNTGTPDGAVSLDSFGRFQILSQMSADAVVDSVSVYMPASTTYRVAVYASDSATQADSLALVYDFGSVTSGGSAGINTLNSSGSPSIASGKYPVIAVKGGASNYMYISSVESLPDGDVIATRRGWLDTNSAAAVAWPSTSGSDDDGDYPARTMRVSMDYTEGGTSIVPHRMALLGVG
jgi:hypothetical protein